MDTKALIWPAVLHRQLPTADGEIHYVEAGTGEPVLLIHGGHGAWVHWIANIDALAQHRRVLALDLPGFGHSYDPGRRLDLSGYGAVVGSFIAALGLCNVALVGFSFGALVATTIASNQPDTVKSLMLINPAGLGERSPEARAIPERLSALAREQGMHAGVAGSLEAFMLHDVDHISEALIELIAGCVTRTRYATRSLSLQPHLIPMLEQVSQRTMVMIGAEDPYQKHEFAQRRAEINRVLGGACVRVVNDAAHWLQYERPGFFNRALLKFIQHPAS